MKKYDMSKLSKSLVEKIIQMPKVEIHVHMEGAVDPMTYYLMANENRVKLPVKNLKEWKRFFNFSDFRHFINVYTTAVGAIRKPADYTLLIERFYKHQAEQHIIYSEAYLSASFLIQKFKEENILDAISMGIQKGASKYNCKINFIPDISRQYPSTQEKVLEFIIKGRDRGIFIGIGLGGLEMGFPAELFKETFKVARGEKLHVVVHAGEAAGPESIWSALRDLRAERIGHGISCLEDKQLVSYLKEKQIPLEISPWSNYCTEVVKRDTPHPIRKMYDEGLFCTISTDDPAMFSTDLKDEFLLLASQGFTWEELWQLNVNSLEAAFLQETEKSKYRKQLQEFNNIYSNI